MAPFDGDLAKLKVQQLKFFKTAQAAVNPSTGKWATDELMYALLSLLVQLTPVFLTIFYLVRTVIDGASTFHGISNRGIMSYVTNF